MNDTYKRFRPWHGVTCPRSLPQQAWRYLRSQQITATMVKVSGGRS